LLTTAGTANNSCFPEHNWCHLAFGRHLLRVICAPRVIWLRRHPLSFVVIACKCVTPFPPGGKGCCSFPPGGRLGRGL